MDKLKKAATFDDLIKLLQELFVDNQVDVDQVEELLLSYKSKISEWKKYTFFDNHKYTRNLVDCGNEKYNLILICWSQGQGSAIHDHANSHCFMKMLSGNLHEIRYEWPEENEKLEENPSKMKVISETEFKLNNVYYINDSIGLHRVENRSHTVPAVSLHVYTPPFDKCNVFDQRTGYRTEAVSNFYTKYGKKVEVKNLKNSEGNEQLCYTQTKN